MPEISVITPVYQGERLLPDCAESVRRQTFSDWELLLIDDGSADNSRKLCEQYAAEDPRIRVLAQPQNMGVSAARNRGLQEARGRYGAERVETLLPSGVYDYEEIREKFLNPLFGERLRAPLTNGYIWRFLFRNDNIRESGARFEGPYLEDELFLLEYFGASKPDGRLAVTETPLYRYLQNAPLYEKSHGRDGPLYGSQGGAKPRLQFRGAMPGLAP